MKTFSLISSWVLGFFCCAALSGAEPIVLSGLADGVYVLRVSKGVVTLEVAKEISLNPTPTPGPGPTPKPDPTPTPTPDTLTVRAKAIKAVAEKVTADPSRQETAGQLATLYSEIEKKVTDGSIKTQEMIAFAVKYGTDTLLNGKGTKVKQAWQPVRDVFTEQWAKLLEEGKPDAEYAKLLTEASAGLSASAPDKKSIDIAMIMAIIKMIMELLAMFS